MKLHFDDTPLLVILHYKSSRICSREGEDMLNWAELCRLSIHDLCDFRSWVASFIVLVTSVAANCLTLVAGIILTTGFNKWCDVVSKERTR